MGRSRGMGGTTAEMEIDLVAGKRNRVVHTGKWRRVPAKGDVYIIEQPFPDHEALGGPALFRRATVIAYAPLDTVGREVILHGGGSKKRPRAEQIVSAAMAVTAGFGRLFLIKSRNLAQPRQASNSPRMAMTGPSSPASPITAVGRPATPRSTRNPSASSIAAWAALDLYSS